MTTVDPLDPIMPPEKTFILRGVGVWGILANKERIFGLVVVEGSLGECRSEMDWAGKHALAWRGVGFAIQYLRWDESIGYHR